MNLSEFTYGRTPAAMYLARTLNEIDNVALTRSCGKKITATNKSVSDLLDAYENGACPAKTVANCLRLMRAEVVAGDNRYEGWRSKSKESLVDQLCRNVQIGYIKRGLRLCQVARKGERVMENPSARSSHTESVVSEENCEFDRLAMTETFYYFVDHTNGEQYLAGSTWNYEGDKMHTSTDVVLRDYLHDMTPEVLMERSNRRCTRLGKAHTKVT